MSYEEKIEESIQILKALGLPEYRINLRTAKTLIALVNLAPSDNWTTATNPLLGIRGIIDFIRNKFSEKIAENSRETFRDESVKPLIAAGILDVNPDDPSRPKNSSRFCYRVNNETLKLIQNYGTNNWQKMLENYLLNRTTLIELYAQKRTKFNVNIVIETGQEFIISPGAHSQLIKKIIEDFRPRYAPKTSILYIGETGTKWKNFDLNLFSELGIKLTPESQMPDVILYDSNNKWMFLIESVTSNGPIDSRRFFELKSIFQSNKISLIFVTAFPTRKKMREYLNELAWETEVWVSDSPDHLIHFNGHKFLGPY